MGGWIGWWMGEGEGRRGVEGGGWGGRGGRRSIGSVRVDQGGVSIAENGRDGDRGEC
jgi:hypothetical protein